MLKPFRGPSKGEGSGFPTPDPTLPTPPPAKSCQNKSGWCAPGPGLQTFLHRTMQLVFPRNLQTIRWQHGKLLKGHNSHTCQNRAWGRLAAWYNNSADPEHQEDGKKAKSDFVLSPWNKQPSQNYYLTWGKAILTEKALTYHDIFSHCITPQEMLC